MSQGRISENDMEAQLRQLEGQSYEYNRQHAEHRSKLRAKRHTLSLAQQAQQFVEQIQAGLSALEKNANELAPQQFNVLFEELQAWRFADKFPNDKPAQLNWAILEEKRRILRTLVQKIVIGKHVGNNERWIESHLTFKMPVPTEDFLDSSDQSLDYVPWEGEKSGSKMAA